MGKYEVIIWWSKEDNCYLADVPELSGCMADGESLTEVAQVAEEAIKLWIEVNKKRGVNIPVPIQGRDLFPFSLATQP
jgi:predicted RNase H-like HicB family nuclease